MKLYRLIPILTIVLTATSCGNSEKKDAVTYDVTTDITQVPTKTAEGKDLAANPIQKQKAHEPVKNSEPYILGREHATKLHTQLTTTEEIQNELLDINARAYNIRNRIGQQAADDYLAGIRDYLQECSDTLATTLF